MVDKTFPTLDCAACILTPKMVEVSQSDRIKLYTYSEVEEVSGYARHTQYCDLVRNPPEERSLVCSCGLTTARAKLDALGKEGT